MDKEAVRETEIENEGTPGERDFIADAIYAGLLEIAGGLRAIAKSLAGDDGEPELESEFYLDGTKK